MENAPQSYGGRELTAVLENYLEIIFKLEMDEGAARAGAIAEAAGVSRSTVTSSLKALKAMGLVEYSPYSLIRLTDEGLVIGRDIAHRHIVFQELLETILHIEHARADEVACMLEHVVPADVVRRVGQFVLFLKNRPEMWENWMEQYKKDRLAKDSHGSHAKMEEERRKRVFFSEPNPYS
ncbi:MAG: HTH-type transcriptional regulator MntR [Desulfovibrio sp.]